MLARRPIYTAILTAFSYSAGSRRCVGRRLGLRRRFAAGRFDLAYNLDHDQAIALLRKAIELDPSDPANHRALASMLWLNMLFQRGAVTVDHYLGSFSRTQVEMSKPPAELDAEFREHVESAIQLAGAASQRRRAIRRRATTWGRRSACRRHT